MATRGKGAVLALACVGLALTTACGERSRVDANAEIHIGGAVLQPQGSPLAGRPVRLSAGVTDAEVGFAIVTVGMSCAAGGCRGNKFDTTTDASGRYDFTVRGRDTQSSFGEAVSELVSATAAPGLGQISGAAVSARFKVQTTSVQLPDLHLVDPAVQVAPGPNVGVMWKAAAPGPYDVNFENGSTVPAWSLTTTSVDAKVDARVLEDTSGRVVVSGGSQDAVAGSRVDIRWRSPGLPYAGAGPPPSRGARCRYAGSAAVMAQPCGLTDGNLAVSAQLPSPCPSPPPGSTTTSVPCGPTPIDILLAPPVPAEVVVVRGCAAACPVSVSADGTTFEPVGAAHGEFSTLSVPGQRIAAVRIDTGPWPTEVREVSVWGPAPPAGAQPGGSSALGHLRQTFGTAPSGRRGRALLLVAAGVVLSGVLVLAGFALGRRPVRARGPAARPE